MRIRKGQIWKLFPRKNQACVPSYIIIDDISGELVHNTLIFSSGNSFQDVDSIDDIRIILSQYRGSVADRPEDVKLIKRLLT